MCTESLQIRTRINESLKICLEVRATAKEFIVVLSHTLLVIRILKRVCVRVCGAEDHRRVQAKERGTVRSAEPQVDQVAAEAVLSLLLRPRLPRPQPGLPV